MPEQNRVDRPAPRRSREGQVLLGLLGLIVLGVIVSTAAVLIRPPVPTPYPTSASLAALPDCDVPNLTWTVPGWLLRGGAPTAEALTCLAQSGVDVVVDQRLPAEDTLGEAALAAQAGLEYVNLGVPIDTAPDPDILADWITTVEARLDADQVVLVHDAGEGGRVGFWDAVYQMRHRMAGAEAVEKFYIGTDLPFEGAEISCAAGGNGQVQALAEMTGHLSGTRYTPTVDEYGNVWGDCPAPGYMAEWKYPFSALSPPEN